MSKRYVLELTAEELEEHLVKGYTLSAIDRRLDELKIQAQRDRELSDLRLPWRAEQTAIGYWFANDSAGNVPVSERAAKLRSAAPELLEAVKAMKAYLGPEDFNGPYTHDVEALVERALRKVETGVPE